MEDLVVLDIFQVYHIFEHAIGVEWDANSGKFTVYSSIKESIG